MCTSGTWKKVILVALTIGILVPGHAANASVVLLSEFRTIKAYSSVDTPEWGDSLSRSKQSSGDFFDFDESVEIVISHEDTSAYSNAQQNSRISTTSISASGKASANAEGHSNGLGFSPSANAIASSRLFVEFEVVTAQMFDLSGVISIQDIRELPFNNRADVALRSEDGSFEISIETPIIGNNTIPINLSGTLLPNVYTLSAFAYIDADTVQVEADGGTANFSFDFNVAPGPIPAAAWLFSSGLLGLVGMARRKKA